MIQKIIKVHHTQADSPFASLETFRSGKNLESDPVVFSSTQVDQLRRKRREAPSQELLSDCQEGEFYLKCNCDRICHVRRPDDDSKHPLYTLARNRSAVGSCTGNCALSPLYLTFSDVTLEEERLKGSTAPLKNLGLIFRSKSALSQKTSYPKGGIIKSSGSQSLSVRDLTLCGTLFELIQKAKLNEFAGAFPRNIDNWERIYEELLAVKLGDAKSSKTMADFAWMPWLSEFNYGEMGLLEKSRAWPLPVYKPEGLIFGLSEDIAVGDERIFHYFKTGTVKKRVAKEEYTAGRQFFPFPIITKWVETGPYLIIAAYTVKRDKYAYNDELAIRRAVAIGILDEDTLIPVDSQHERDVANLLRRLKVPFRKPVVDVERFRPDFILPKHNAYIEVQGRKTPEYKAHKDERLRQMEQDPYWKHQKQLRYDPNKGDKIWQFEKKLTKIL